ncbi:MAG: ATP-binding cassette domain-containing protein [Saprospiraceae bacterium]|jgi:ABC-2 type transport system ATP-binding protein|nr:ATP-binding cassette domain-containing protein [Saprospiraceae bacterium]
MLTIHQPTYSYGKNQVLKNLSMNVPEGEIHGILGRNGAGKTTLFRLIANWLPAPAGAITWQGAPVQKRQTAYLETAPYFYPYLKGVEYLRLIRDEPQQIETWNKLFDLPLDDLIDGYSTGMQKKLAFIGVLLQDRPILILDEPFNGVDLAGNEMMMAVIRRRRNNKGITLISSHILHTLTHVCDRISLLEHGQIAPTFELKDFAALEKLVREEAHKRLDQTLENWP